MIDAFVEGVRSIVQACHLVILFPVAMLVIAGRARWQVVAGAVLGIVLGGWVFMTRWLVLDDTQIRWSSLIVIGATAFVGLGFVVARRGSPTADDGGPVTAPFTGGPWVSGGITAVVAFIVTTWWRPCVGEQLGDILTRAPDDPWGQLLPSIGFMLGVATPIVLLGAAIAAWEPSARTGDRLAIGTTAIGVVLGLSVLAGRHGEIVATLFDWSQPFV